MITRAQTVRAALVAAALSLGGMATAVAADEPRLYVTVDKSQLISFRSSDLSKVAVTNPAIADVHVISPKQLLVHGKTPGTTSLLVFHGARMEYFDIVVHPVPGTTPRSALMPEQEFGVEVHRAGRVSHQLFVRDTERTWVELGTAKTDAEAGKK